MTKTNKTKINWKWTCAFFAMMIGWAIMDSCVDKARANLAEKYPETQKVLCSGKVNHILVEKSKKKMTLFDDTNCIVKEYNVVTGKNPGPKTCDGDKPIDAPARIVGLQVAKTEAGRRAAVGEITGAKDLLIGTEEQPGLLEIAASFLKSGVFFGNPRSSLCNVKYCPAYQHCRFRR